MSRTTGSQNDKRLFFFSVIVFLATCLLVFSVISSRNNSSAITATSTPAQMMTLEPQVIANLTSVPTSLASTGDLATQLNDVERMLMNCPDYSEERRLQMQQHIIWLRNPAQIPRDLLVAFGDNPSARLIVGMATYTSSEWGLRNRSPSSCLLPIGQLLNQMLIAVGEEPVEEFDG